MSTYTASDKSQLIRVLFWACLFAVSLLLIYSETTWSMIAIWSRSDTFAHGFLVLPISIWLVWIKRDHLQIKNIQPAPLVGLLMLPPAFLWLIAWMVDVSVVQQLALVTVLIIGVWAVLGHRLSRVLAFPLLFLYFGVPMGEGLIPPMMDFTAVSTVWLIKLTGIPVYREGLYFSLPSGYWSVVEACSGVRYIIASITVGTLYAYLTYRSTSRRAMFIIVSAIVPIFANTARAFIIVMLGHFSGMTVATGADHLVYGWVFFGLVIFILFWLGNFFREDEKPPAEYASNDSDTQSAASNNRLPLTVLFSLALAFLAPAFAYNSASRQVLDENTVVEMPGDLMGWERVNSSSWFWEAPAMVEGSATAIYLREETQVSVSVQYDDGSPRSTDVLGSSTYLAEWRSGSRVGDTNRFEVSVDDTVFVVDEAEIVGIDEGLRAWSWYDVGGVSTSNAYRAKIQQALAYLGMGRLGTYRVVIAARDEDDPEVAREVLAEFLTQYSDALQEQLRQAAATNR